MTPLSCSEVTDRIDALVRGELDADLRSEVEHHLSGCADCRRAQKEAQLARAVFGGVPRPACPDHVVARIWSTVDHGSAAAVPLETTSRALETTASPATSGVGPRVQLGNRLHDGRGGRLRRWLAPARLIPALSALAAVALLLGPWSRVAEPRGISPAVLAGLPPEVVAAVPKEMLANMTESELRVMVDDARLAFAIVAEAVGRSTRVAGEEMRYGLTFPVMEGMSRSVHHLPPSLYERASS